MAQGSQSIHSLPIIEIDQNLLSASAEYAKISALLPSYDGNKRTLNFFIKAVENVLEIVSNAEKDPSIGCLIVKKLSGRAVEILSEATDFKTWLDIKRILQDRFGEFRDEITLIQELNNVTRNKMDLDTFGERIRDLTCTLISLDPLKRDFYEEMGIGVFTGQLNPLLSLAIRMQKPSNLERTIILAKQEETKLKTYRLLNNNTPSVQRPINRPNSFSYNNNYNNQLPGRSYNKPNQPFIKQEDVKQKSFPPNNKYKINYQQNQEEEFPTENSEEETLQEPPEINSEEMDFLERMTDQLQT